LILGIHGPSGEGKTYQCEQVLKEINAQIAYVSGGELESREAGEPAELIRKAYERAASYRISSLGELRPAAVFINDIDAAIGDWGELVQYTVNRQNVFGELMHLADFPEQLRNESTVRVPIIATGNDFTKLYGPLIRLGRMHLFAWRPTQDEKLGIVNSIYPELTVEECQFLLASFADQPASFFSELRSHLEDEMVWSYIEQIGVAEAFGRLSHGEVPRLRSVIEVMELQNLGNALLKSRALMNYLEG